MREQREHKTIPILTPLLAAVQFLTIVPPLIKRPFSAKELGRSVGYFPLTGLLIGWILVLTSRVASGFFPENIAYLLVLLVWVLLSGAIHLDGFLDTCDGLFGGMDREQRLEIMRDERLGAYAFVGGFFLLAAKYISLDWIPMGFLIAAPVIGRWCIAWMIVVFPYARPSGLGKWMKDNATWRQLVIAGLTTALVLYWIMDWYGLAIMAVITVVVSLICLWVMGRINGMTGDVYGAVCELSELLFLITLQIGTVTVWAH